MRGNNVKLQNDYKTDMLGYSWSFLVDTCIGQSHWTGKTDCHTDGESMAMINDFIIELKTSTQFFSAKTYLDNDRILSSKFSRETYRLSKLMAFNIEYTTQLTKTQFSDRVFYTDQFLQSIKHGTSEFKTYDVSLKT